MYFQLRKLILWPRDNKAPRVVDFQPGAVNVISGASKTGKSAVVPIIDYCLGSDKCAIPVGVIRENCSWFGILLDTVEGQKLLARREPGDQKETGDMFMMEAPIIEVPATVEGKTTNTDLVKGMLNRLAGLSSLDFEPGAEGTYKARPSFRDLVAFTFQPQNIVANPDVFFFRTDLTEYKEKLKTLFPYVLGAVTAEILQARFELERLNRNLRRKEAELRELVNASSAWRLEAQSWLRQAIELGLLSADQLISDDWNSILDVLRRITTGSGKTATPSLAGIDVALNRLQVLRDEESQVALTLTEHRNRLNELRRLLESSQAYGGALRVQRDRLSISEWLRKLTIESPAAETDPIASLSAAAGPDRLKDLCDALAALELRLRSHPSFSDALDKEMIRQRAATETVLERLSAIRQEVNVLERTSQEAQEERNKFDRTERFVGRLDQALRLYDRADQSSGVRDEITALRAQIAALQGIVSDAEIKRKLRNALDRVEATASNCVSRLDAEWPDAPVKLILDELTVKVVRGKRDDYLWEIGSGANWLAYHVAMTLALQRFFLEEPHHPVPGMLVYDQPSQVYFPKTAARPNETSDVSWRDQDVLAVRKIFSLLSEEVLHAKGRLQVIVLDHADEDVWGNLPAVQLTEEWRTKALVPSDWLSDGTQNNLPLI